MPLGIAAILTAVADTICERFNLVAIKRTAEHGRSADRPPGLAFAIIELGAANLVSADKRGSHPSDCRHRLVALSLAFGRALIPGRGVSFSW
jgi:hypothetical protein